MGYEGGAQPEAAGGVTSADLVAVQVSLQAQIDQLGAAIGSIPLPPQFLNADPSGAALGRGGLAFTNGLGGFDVVPWAKISAIFPGLAAWQGGTGDTPIQVATVTVPQGTNGVAGYSASAQFTSGSVDSTGKYASHTVVVGAKPAWATINNVAGGWTVTGTPNAVATTAFTIRTTDQLGWTKDVAITIVVVAVSGTMTFVLPTNLTGYVGSALNVPLAAFVNNAQGAVTFDRGTSPTLPNHHTDLNGGATALVNNNAGGVYVTADLGSFSVKIRATDGTTTVTQTVTMTIVPAQTPAIDIGPIVSGDFNLTTGVGTYAFTNSGGGHAVVPSTVVAQILQADAAMAAVDGRIYSSVAGNFALGAPAGATSWNFLLPALKCPNWDLDGTTAGTQAVGIVLAPKQPVNSVAKVNPAPNVVNQPAGLLNFAAIPNLQVKFAGINGNAANQYGRLAIPAGANPDGCYFHGIRFSGCTNVTGALGTVKNIRGVVGGNTSNGPNGVPSAEVFASQDINTHGTINLTLGLDSDDGGTQGQTASGCVSQYGAVDAQPFVYSFTQIRNQRHGFGTFAAVAGGTVLIIPAGFTGSGCGNLFNIEDGYDPTGHTAYVGPTGPVTIAGVLGAAWVCGTNTNDVVRNGNNGSGVNAFVGAGALVIDGCTSTGSDTFARLTGQFSSDVTIGAGVHVVSPTNAATQFAASGAKLTSEENHAKITAGASVHLTVGGSAAVKPTSAAIPTANGAWALV